MLCGLHVVRAKSGSRSSLLPWLFVPSGGRRLAHGAWEHASLGFSSSFPEEHHGPLRDSHQTLTDSKGPHSDPLEMCI